MSKFKFHLCTFSLISILISCTIHLSGANLNLYLNQVEVRRLLGLQAELFYVRDGVINEYALNFVVPVPAHLSALHFTWQSLAGRPLPYAISITVSNPEALAAPILNVSDHGQVPTHAQTFVVELPCTGVVAAEVDVLISVNVTLNRAASNVTRLNFKRVKICLRGPPDQVSTVISDVAEASTVISDVAEASTVISDVAEVTTAISDVAEASTVISDVAEVTTAISDVAEVSTATYDVAEVSSSAVGVSEMVVGRPGSQATSALST